MDGGASFQDDEESLAGVNDWPDRPPPGEVSSGMHRYWWILSSPDSPHTRRANNKASSNKFELEGTGEFVIDGTSCSSTTRFLGA